MHKEKKYYVYSILMALFLVIMVSNVEMLSFLFNRNYDYSSVKLELYFQDENLVRFATEDINRDIYYMGISVPMEIADFELKVYYQNDQTEDFFPIAIERISNKNDETIFRLQNVKRVKNIYIDIHKMVDIHSIMLVKFPPVFKITSEALILGVSFLILVLVMHKKRKFLKDVAQNRDVLKLLLSNDLNSRYAGAFLGKLWPYIQPVISIFVFWFVFQFGFNSSPIQGIPFILWFLPAYIAWMYFQDVISYSTGCLKEYSYLVKKIKFKVNIIPMIKVLSAFKIHVCFIAVTFIIYTVYGIKPSIKCIQMLYYSLGMIFLLSGVSWLIATLSVFVRDIAPIINIVLQIGYFAVPIFWNDDMMQPIVVKILKLNPAYYIIQGYRDSMCNGSWFWEDMNYTIYYWVVSIVIFCIGLWLFDGLKKHFSDLL